MKINVEETFEGKDWSGETLDDREFIDCRFVKCSLRETVLRECRLVNCVFEGCDLSLAKFPDCRFNEVRFEGSKLLGIEWTLARWSRIAGDAPVSFRHSVLNDSTFLSLALPKLSIRDCTAREVDFRESDLKGADFGGTDLTGALFSGTNLESADFRRARNYQIVPALNRMKGARFSLPEALSLLYAMDVEIDHGGDED